MRVAPNIFVRLKMTCANRPTIGERFRNGLYLLAIFALLFRLFTGTFLLRPVHMTDMAATYGKPQSYVMHAIGSQPALTKPSKKAPKSRNREIGAIDLIELVLFMDHDPGVVFLSSFSNPPTPPDFDRPPKPPKS